MANGEIANEIRTLLAAGGKISTPTALQLSLSLMVQLYDKVEGLGTRMDALDAKEKDTANKSIVNWVDKHPKLTLGIVAVMLVFDVRTLAVTLLQALGLLH